MKKKKKIKSAASPKEIFLETSVIRKLFFGHHLHKNLINDTIKGTKYWSSFFVLLEYKRSVLLTLIELYFVSLEEDTPQDALAYLSETYSSRKPKIILNAIGEMLKDEELSNDKDKFLITLELLIASVAQRFEDLIGKNFITNRSGCPLAKLSLNDGITTEEKYSNFIKLIKCKADCAIDKFWKENKSNLKNLITEGSLQRHTKNKAFNKVRLLIESHIINISAFKSITNCLKLSDIIIGLEMPANLRMLTFDKSFSSICEILKKEFTVLPSLAELKKPQLHREQFK